jgi:hypothetical protein
MLDHGPVKLDQLNVPPVEKFCKLYESQELALISRALREHEQSGGQVGQYQHAVPVEGPEAPPVRSSKQQQQSIQAAQITKHAQNQVEVDMMPSIAKRAAAATSPLPTVQDSDLPDQDLRWLQLPIKSYATSSQCSSEGAMHTQLLQSAAAAAAAAGSPASAAVQGARQDMQQHAGRLQEQVTGRTAASVQQCQQQQQQQLEVQVAAAFAQQFAALPAADACSGPVRLEVIKLFVASAASASLQSRVSS